MDKNYSQPFSECSDEILAVKAKNDKKAAAELLSRYFCTIEAKAKRYALSFSEDMAQEGFIGLLQAVETYDERMGNKFSTYANVCIKNKMFSAFEKQKDAFSGESEELNSEDVKARDETPENIVIANERLREIYDKIISALSEQEWRVFQLFLTGLAYNQIALELNVPPKTVDNAMQRVRRKLKSVLRSGQD